MIQQQSTLVNWKKYHGCRRYRDSHRYVYGMGTGTVMNGHVGIQWGLLNGCEIKRKRNKHAINVVVDV